MFSEFDIKEQVITKTHTACKVRIHIHNLVLNTSAMISYNLLDKEGRVIESNSFELKGADYEAWGSDDQYIIDLVVSKIQ